MRFSSTSEFELDILASLLGSKVLSSLKSSFSKGFVASLVDFVNSLIFFRNKVVTILLLGMHSILWFLLFEFWSFGLLLSKEFFLEKKLFPLYQMHQIVNLELVWVLPNFFNPDMDGLAMFLYPIMLQIYIRNEQFAYVLPRYLHV